MKASLQEARLRAKHTAATYRRRLFERFGNLRYSRPAAMDVDRKLEAYLPPTGFFVEAGANDGYSYSNTYYLERIRGWHGLLIEPMPSLYAQCRRERRRSTVVNCALVAPDYPEPTVTMTYAHLMSMVNDPMHFTGPAKGKHMESARRFYGITPREVAVPARTLTSLLDAAGAPRVDFLSLDVEGYELPALRGLDLARYRPQYMLIEALSDDLRADIDAYLAPAYTRIDHFEPWDDLYRCETP